MYKRYKEKLAYKEFKKWDNYSLEIIQDIADKLNQFMPTKE